MLPTTGVSVRDPIPSVCADLPNELTAKGFRYAEVPISYAVRTSGGSFIRLGAYLRRVLPAVHHELNTP